MVRSAVGIPRRRGRCRWADLGYCAPGVGAAVLPSDPSQGGSPLPLDPAVVDFPGRPRSVRRFLANPRSLMGRHRHPGLPYREMGTACGPGSTTTIAPLYRSGGAPGCMAGFLWPSTARRPLRPRIFPCRHPQAGPVGIPRARACGAKIHGLTGRSAALALRPRLAGFGSVPSSRP